MAHHITLREARLSAPVGPGRSPVRAASRPPSPALSRRLSFLGAHSYGPRQRQTPARIPEKATLRWREVISSYENGMATSKNHAYRQVAALDNMCWCQVQPPGQSPIRIVATPYKPMDFKTAEVHETSILVNQGDRSDEKPMSLGATVLFCFALASFIIAIIIEILADQSQRNGGLALSASADGFSTFVQFCYLFLPTIVAVIYSLLWSWIDLDVKRIQPWLEMSRPAGATAESSIFLDYPYDFIAFVPIKAARRR
ncbi:hypothetical protein CMUS01_08727 [Colletotrichum musicola]|uniref:Uncharacterized protein n=1 Tax=Colletotrichum musicola TaxID=2175873 RepID=A0A8H6KBN3_9PEZI|nr:hypothetical protein CMUS01_08727 [Colletotrichum musicola]